MKRSRTRWATALCALVSPLWLAAPAPSQDVAPFPQGWHYGPYHHAQDSVCPYGGCLEGQGAYEAVLDAEADDLDRQAPWSAEIPADDASCDLVEQSTDAPAPSKETATETAAEATASHGDTWADDVWENDVTAGEVSQGEAAPAEVASDAPAARPVNTALPHGYPYHGGYPHGVPSYAAHAAGFPYPGRWYPGPGYRGAPYPIPVFNPTEPAPADESASAPLPPEPVEDDVAAAEVDPAPADAVTTAEVTRSNSCWYGESAHSYGCQYDYDAYGYEEFTAAIDEATAADDAHQATGPQEVYWFAQENNYAQNYAAPTTAATLAAVADDAAEDCNGDDYACLQWAQRGGNWFADINSEYVGVVPAAPAEASAADASHDEVSNTAIVLRWELVAKAFPVSAYVIERLHGLDVAAKAFAWISELPTVEPAESSPELHVEEHYFDTPEFQEITAPSPTPRQAVRDLAETLEEVGVALQTIARHLIRLADEPALTSVGSDEDFSPVSPWEVEHQSRNPSETDAR